MKFEALEFSIKCGMEIEIVFAGKIYFLRPDYSSKIVMNGTLRGYTKAVLYECANYENPTELFRGSIEDVLHFQFDGVHTLSNDCEKMESRDLLI